jgi:hypothetical protein
VQLFVVENLHVVIIIIVCKNKKVTRMWQADLNIAKLKRVYASPAAIAIYFPQLGMVMVPWADISLEHFPTSGDGVVYRLRGVIEQNGVTFLGFKIINQERAMQHLREGIRRYVPQ